MKKNESRIYTRRGDEGQTRDVAGRGVSKSDPAIEAVGCLDELAAQVGLSLAQATAPDQLDVRRALESVQMELPALCVVLGGGKARLDESAVTRMERIIDDACAKLPELSAFILPGGCELACRLHVVRTACRRAERAMVALAEGSRHVHPLVLQYVNRLGDLLFVLARLANRNAGVAGSEWRPQPGGGR